MGRNMDSAPDKFIFGPNIYPPLNSCWSLPFSLFLSKSEPVHFPHLQSGPSVLLRPQPLTRPKAGTLLLSPRWNCLREKNNKKCFLHQFW